MNKSLIFTHADGEGDSAFKERLKTRIQLNQDAEEEESKEDEEPVEID